MTQKTFDPQTEAFISRWIDAAPRDMTSDEMQWVIDNPQKVKSCLLSMMRPVPEAAQPLTFGKHLQLVTGAESLLIPAGNDERCIAERNDLFTGWIDPDFKNWKLDLKQVPTEATPVQVLEIVKGGKFADIYAIPNRSFESLCFTQTQITLFVETHKKWLRTDGYGTFFLFKKEVEGKDKFFVAYVRFDGSGQLRVYVSSVSRDRVWRARSLPWFVIPQLPI